MEEVYMLDIKSETQFLNTCKMVVRDYTKIHNNSNEEFDVYVAWYCKTLQNFKVVLATPLIGKEFYEFTYNGDKQEAYLDVYTKTNNQIIRLHDTK
jgi:hypothetical protein